MSDYRRLRQSGGIYFFSVVTHQRRPIFNDDNASRLLREAIESVRQSRPFVIEAAVLLPDHLHMIWSLPPGDSDYSTRWRLIKGRFSHEWASVGGSEGDVTQHSKSEGRRGIWQRRFMEHTIRDEDDFIRHVEYIHYNPVKHDYVRCPKDWAHSSFHRFVRQGKYDLNWCCQCETHSPPDSTFDADWLE